MALTEHVEEYLNIFNNYYNEINFVSNYWKSPNANYFISTTGEEKIKNREFYYELDSLCELYNYILDRYSNISEELYIKEEGDDVIVDKILQNTIDDIKVKCDAISSTATSLSEKMQTQKNKITKNKNGLLEYKDDVKFYYNKVNEIEEDIAHKIAEFEIAKVTENTNEVKSLGTTDEVVYDLPKLNVLFEKLKNCYNEFEENYKNIQLVFDNIPGNYTSENSKKLEGIHTELLNKYSIIKNNINNNLELLKKNVDSLSEASKVMHQNIDLLKDTARKLQQIENDMVG